jgi:hypothetical protein
MATMAEPNPAAINQVIKATIDISGTHPRRTCEIAKLSPRYPPRAGPRHGMASDFFDHLDRDDRVGPSHNAASVAKRTASARPCFEHRQIWRA